MTDAHNAVAAYNKRAWNNLVANGNKWTVPVAADVIAKARHGDLSLLLTPTHRLLKRGGALLSGFVNPAQSEPEPHTLQSRSPQP